MSSFKVLTGKTVSQVQGMSVSDYVDLFDKLEDINAHTACAMLNVARHGKEQGLNIAQRIRALELIDDMHRLLGFMPREAIQLRHSFAGWGE